MNLLTSAKMLLAAGGQPQSVNEVFSTTLYTGDGTAPKTRTFGTKPGLKGALHWIKGRALTNRPHYLIDSLRDGSYAVANTDAPGVSYPRITNIRDNRYDMTSADNLTNATTDYVAWSFVRARKFFDFKLVSHTTGTATQVTLSRLDTIGMATAKELTQTANLDWNVYHRSLAANATLTLNSTTASGSTGLLTVSGNVLTLSASLATGTYVVYGWGHDTSAKGFIQAGSYTGNGSTTGPIVTLGWQPQWLMIRATAIGNNWTFLDDKRVSGSQEATLLCPTISSSESSMAEFVSWRADGFQLATTLNGLNGSGSTFLYLAIRKGP